MLLKRNAFIYDGKGQVDYDALRVVIKEGDREIPRFAFSECGYLSTIVLPSSITSIGNGAFIGCESLTTIRLPSSIIEIGIGAFKGCTSLSSIEIPSHTIIGDEAFENTTRINYYKLNDIGKVLNNLTEPDIRKIFQVHYDIYYWINPQNDFVNKSIPLQQLVEAKCSFTVIHNFISSGFMKAIEKEHPELKNIVEAYYNDLFKKEVARAAEEGSGLYPIWRARIAIVGSDRSGKTSTVRSIRGEKFDAVSDSTKGLEKTEADVTRVRDLGVDVNDANVAFDGNEQKEVSKPWSKTEEKGYNNRYQSVAARLRNKLTSKETEEEKKAMLETFQNIIMQNSVKQSYKAAGVETKIRKVPTEFNISEHTPNSKQGPNKSGREKKGVEPDVIEQKGQLDIDVGEDGQIRISVWDNGGQTVFRTTQHLYIVRNSCYVLVFNIADFLGDEETKKQALDHLHFWLHSIKHHGVCSDDDNKDSTNPSILYPPVILVGTHLDSVKKLQNKGKRKITLRKDTEIVNAKLGEINTILINEFGSIGIFSTIGTSKHDEPSLSSSISLDRSSNPSPNNICIKGREFLYNSEQNLCYWPIDNKLDHEKEESNIPILRSIIIRSIMEDPINYIDNPILTTWLDAIDRLSEISSKAPILPLHDSNNGADNSETTSVVSVLRKAGALNNASDPKSRALIFMKYCHQVGLFVYFDKVPGLQDYCILNPQWLIDRITYVIRDIKLHQLPSDTHAMELDGGKHWKELRDEGILDLRLLQEFWGDVDVDTFDFLIKLMIELRIFGRFATKSNDNIVRRKFIVPSVRTSPFHAVDSMSSNNPFSPKERIEKYFGISSLEWSKLCQWSFSFNDFLPIGCYNRLVASLVDDWKIGYSESKPPILLPSAALLCMGPNHMFALVIDIRLSYCFGNKQSTSSCQSSSIKIISKNVDEMKIILYHIRSSLDIIIKDFYKGSLNHKLIDGKGTEMGSEKSVYDTLNQYRLAIKDQPETYSNKQRQEERQKREMQDIIYFFEKHGMAKVKSARIANLLFQSEYDDELTPIYLYDLYEGSDDKKTFEDEILKEEFGISKKLDRVDILSVLRKCDKPIDYLLGYFSGDKLKELDVEREEIRKYLFAANLKCEIYEKDPAEFFLKPNSNEYKVLHFAMHGNSGTLAFKSKIRSKYIVRNITHSCNGPKGCNGTIECIFLNGCNLKKLAGELHNAGVKYVLGWETPVDDVAAREFASAIYRCLVGKRDDILNFKNAYDRAVDYLKLKGWLLLDPAKKEEIIAKQKDEMNPTLKAAGIPFIFTNDENSTALSTRNAICSLRGSSNAPLEIEILNDIISWPSDGNNNDLKVLIKSKQFFDPKDYIELSKDNMNKKLKVKCLVEETSKYLHGEIIYKYGLWNKKMVAFHKIDWRVMQTMSLTNLDEKSEGNINKVKLMSANSNNLNDLPKEYHDLYSKKAYEFLITGCTMKDNWSKIQNEGYIGELHNLFKDMPDQEPIFCYLFTAKGDIGSKNVAYARIDGAKAEKGEIKKFAKNVRRMFTGLYDDINETFQDSDEEFLKKLGEAEEQNVYSEWNLRGYETKKWFFNELPACDRYQEVIFSSEEGSELKQVLQCTFPPYNRRSKVWPLPKNITVQKRPIIRRISPRTTLQNSNQEQKARKKRRK